MPPGPRRRRRRLRLLFKTRKIAAHEVSHTWVRVPPPLSMVVLLPSQPVNTWSDDTAAYIMPQSYSRVHMNTTEGRNGGKGEDMGCSHLRRPCLSRMTRRSRGRSRLSRRRGTSRGWGPAGSSLPPPRSSPENKVWAVVLGRCLKPCHASARHFFILARVN